MMPYLIGSVAFALFMGVMMIPTLVVVQAIGDTGPGSAGRLSPARSGRELVRARAFFLAFCLVLALAYLLLALAPFYLRGIHRLPIGQIEGLNMARYAPFALGVPGNLLQAMLLYVSGLALGLHLPLLLLGAALVIGSHLRAAMGAREVKAALLLAALYALNLALSVPHHAALRAWLFD